MRATSWARRSWAWWRAHDLDLGATRRATRTALVMPVMFAIGAGALDDATIATFAAFGSFALLLLADVRGTTRQRVAVMSALTAAGAGLVCLGSVVSGSPWLAAAVTIVVGFALLFSGVMSPVIARTSTAMLLAFVLPVTSPADVSTIPARLLGWCLAGVVALGAISLLWPTRPPEAVRSAAVACCRDLSARLRSTAPARTQRPRTGREHAPGQAALRSDAELQLAFYAGAVRPADLSTDSRTTARLVDKLSWLSSIVATRVNSAVEAPLARPMNSAVDHVRLAAAESLDRVAEALSSTRPTLEPLTSAQATLRRSAQQLLLAADQPPIPPAHANPDANPTVNPSGVSPHGGADVASRELAVATDLVVDNTILLVEAGQRSIMQRLLGRMPVGVRSPVRAGLDRLTSHLFERSVWFHNSVRGGVALGGAVLLADLSHTQHSFWVVLGALSALSSSARTTGRTIWRSLLGTAAGVIGGAIIVTAAAGHPAALWVLLPISVLFAGVAPTVLSFAAGQAAFTITLMILSNVAAPVGYQVGVVRLQDIAIGVLVSAVLGVTLWPRGATPMLSRALADAYRTHAQYLHDAVRRAVGEQPWSEPRNMPSRAAAAAAQFRLDDTLRQSRSENVGTPTGASTVAALIAEVTVPRLVGDAILDLWRPSDDARAPDGPTASSLVHAARAAMQWYTELGDALVRSGPVPPARDPVDLLLLGPETAASTAHQWDGPSPDEGTALSRTISLRTATRARWTAGHLANLSLHQASLIALAGTYLDQLTIERDTRSPRAARRRATAAALR